MAMYSMMPFSQRTAHHPDDLYQWQEYIPRMKKSMYQGHLEKWTGLFVGLMLVVGLLHR